MWRSVSIVALIVTYLVGIVRYHRIEYLIPTIILVLLLGFLWWGVSLVFQSFKANKTGKAIRLRNALSRVFGVVIIIVSSVTILLVSLHYLAKQDITKHHDLFERQVTTVVPALKGAVIGDTTAVAIFDSDMKKKAEVAKVAIFGESTEVERVRLAIKKLIENRKLDAKGKAYVASMDSILTHTKLEDPVSVAVTNSLLANLTTLLGPRTEKDGKDDDEDDEGNNSTSDKNNSSDKKDEDGFFAKWEWLFKLLSALLVVIPIVLIRKHNEKMRGLLGAKKNQIILLISLGLFITWGSLIYSWHTSSLFYEIIFALSVLIAAILLFQRVNVVRNVAPQESEESMVPYAFDPSKVDPLISKDGETLDAYITRRQRTIKALQKENETYRNYLPKMGIASLILMTVTILICIFINLFTVLTFLAWAVYMGVKLFAWIKNELKEEGGLEEGQETSSVNDLPEEKFFNPKNLRRFGIWLVVACFAAIGFNCLVDTPQTGSGILSFVAWDIFNFVCFAVLMTIFYFVGCIFIVPIRRRWVFTVFNKVVKARNLIIYTPNVGKVGQHVTGLHSPEIRKEIEKGLEDIDTSGKNWLDVGINVTVLSWLFVGIVDIISNYYMVVEATKQTRLLPTKGLKREDLDIKTDAAGTLSFFFRFFYFVGIDPLVSSRLSIGEREEAVPMAGRVIEGFLADKAKGMSFDKAMLYPFIDTNPQEGSVDSDESQEYANLMISLNREFLILAGAYVIKLNVIDRDPEEIIQRAMDELTAKVYKRDHAAVDAERDRIKGEGLGKGKAAEVLELAKILNDPNDANKSANNLAMELLIKLAGAENASIHKILQNFGRNSESSN